MAEKETRPDVVSGYQYEGMESVFCSIIRRLTWALIVAVFLIAALAVYSHHAILEAERAALDYLAQYDYESVTETTTTTTMNQDGQGINIISGGDASYGAERNSQANDKNGPPPQEEQRDFQGDNEAKT